MTTVTATAAPTSAEVGIRGLPDGIVDLLGVTFTTSPQLASMARPIQWEADFQVGSSGNVSMARPIQWEAAQMAVLSGRPPQPQWLRPTIQRTLILLWDDDNWNDGTKPIEPAAVANLLSLLVFILDDTAPTPTIVPTWRGGVQAEWHTNGVDLEIEVDPTEPAQYFFFSHADEEEYEEPVAGNLEQLVGLAGRLSSSASDAGGSL